MGSLSNITNNMPVDCYSFSADSQTRTEVTGDMLREMKAYSPSFLVVFCIINMSLGLLSFGGNALVVFTIAFFSELHQITTNIGLASLATTSFFHGTILNSFLFAVGFNTLVDGCPIFRSLRFAIFYLSYAFMFNSVFNLCIVTAERYIAVAFPLRYFSIFPKELMVKLVAAAWVGSFLCSIPHGIDSPASHTVGKVLWICTFSFTLIFTFYCNIKIFCISKRHKRQMKTQAEAVQQMAVRNQEDFRGSGTVFYIFVTLLVCYVPAIMTRYVKTLDETFADEDKLETLSLIRPWTATFYVMYSALSPFVYFFRSKRLRKYSRKLLPKARRLITDRFA